MSDHSVPTAADGTPLEPGEKLLHGFQRFSRLSSAGGIVLILATIAALVWANSNFYDAYHYIFHELTFVLQLGNWELPHIHSLGYLINDALMALFFLLVGLEIKREILVGELRSVRKAALPIMGAIGGMLVPALIYVGIVTVLQPAALAGESAPNLLRGWGVPMATDIAFALGILALLGKKVPLSLKVFLASLAIVDDLGALIVIAMFYTEELHTNFLMYAGFTVAGLALINILRFRHPIFYVIPGIALWYFILASGVHATIAGVLLAATVPATARVNRKRFLKASRSALDQFEAAGEDGSTPKENSEQRAAAFAIKSNVDHVLPPLHRMEHALHGYCAFLIIPIFALANAGLHLSGDMGTMITDPVTMGVFFGLCVGKPIGVVGFAWLACKLNIASLPTGVTWRHIIGAGFLAGIGFTMALFIANLAFKGDALHLDAAKLGILSASIIATIAGLAILMSCKSCEDADSMDIDDEPTADNNHAFTGNNTSNSPQAKAS